MGERRRDETARNAAIVRLPPDVVEPERGSCSHDGRDRRATVCVGETCHEHPMRVLREDRAEETRGGIRLHIDVEPDPRERGECFRDREEPP